MPSAVTDRRSLARHAVGGGQYSLTVPFVKLAV